MSAGFLGRWENNLNIPRIPINPQNQLSFPRFYGILAQVLIDKPHGRRAIQAHRHIRICHKGKNGKALG